MRGIAMFDKSRLMAVKICSNYDHCNECPLFNKPGCSSVVGRFSLNLDDEQYLTDALDYIEHLEDEIESLKERIIVLTGKEEVF